MFRYFRKLAGCLISAAILMACLSAKAQPKEVGVSDGIKLALKALAK